MKFSDFMRIFKIEITLLVDMVAVAGFLVNPSFQSHIILLIPLLVSGTAASMSAALFNNIYDRDIDPEMHRTAYRSKLVNNSNVRFYTVAGILMLIFAVSLSSIMINLLTSIFIFLGFVSYVFLYTIFLKRRTSWNIVIGGIAGSFPALAGWAAVSNSVSLTSIFIAGIVFLWTPTHFWNLAVTQADDYKNAGIPMLPAVSGVSGSYKWILLNTVILVFYSLLPLFISQIRVGFLYDIIAILLGALFILVEVEPYRRSLSSQSFIRGFHFSNSYLLILLISICLVNYISI
ncbi:MAG: heme o synthase [Thermoplasmataceae archaeon]